jgi:uncharacterized membrane protein
MRTLLIAYGLTAVIFLALDAVWLGAMVGSFYRPRLAGLLLDRPRLDAAVPFYALYIAGVMVFAVAPALDSGGWTRAFLLGAMLGLVAYGTYDLTNLATMRNWSVAVTLVDLVWGAAVTGAAAAGGTALSLWIRGA